MVQQKRFLETVHGRWIKKGNNRKSLGQDPRKCKRSSGAIAIYGTRELLYFIFPCDLYLFSNPVDLHCRRLLSAGTASASSEENHFTWGLQTCAIPAGVSRLSFQSTRYEKPENLL